MASAWLGERPEEAELTVALGDVSGLREDAL